MRTAAEVLAERDHVLLGFDGVVCDVYGGVPARSLADRLKVYVGPGLPLDVAASSEPFDVLAYAVSCGPNTANAVERHLRGLEAEAALATPEVPGAADALRILATRGFTLTVVSDLSADAVRAFLVLRDLAGAVPRISARVRPEVDLFAPNPYRVEQAAEALGAFPRQCVMVCGSAAEVESARAAGVAVITCATDPARRAQLLALDPDAAVEGLAELRLAG
jgi:phosphoglycolate phosphatase-like HAD superfamily hydrolase